MPYGHSLVSLGLYSFASVAFYKAALRASFGYAEALAGATFAASLTSELADSALLCYLRRRSLCERDTKGTNLSFSAERKKDSRPNGRLSFLSKSD